MGILPHYELFMGVWHCCKRQNYAHQRNFQYLLIRGQVSSAFGPQVESSSPMAEESSQVTSPHFLNSSPKYAAQYRKKGKG